MGVGVGGRVFVIRNPPPFLTAAVLHRLHVGALIIPPLSGHNDTASLIAYNFSDLH